MTGLLSAAASLDISVNDLSAKANTHHQKTIFNSLMNRVPGDTARSEKKQNRRRRIALFQKISVLAHHGAEIYVVVRGHRYGAFHVFTSSSTETWPPSPSEIVSQRHF